MASYLLQEDGVSKIILEDGSGFLLLDDGPPPSGPTIKRHKYHTFNVCIAFLVVSVVLLI